MPHSLIWLPHVLKTAGLKVAVVPGWEDRSVMSKNSTPVDVGEIVGVICHHTVGPKIGNMPSLRTLIHGRSDLPGPLAQLGLGRDGTYYVIAAGKCNHAGKGIWKEFVNGNTNFIGIEAENTGGANDFPWPEVQMDAYQRGVAAILKQIGRPAEFCAGHKEYALPKGRKPDTSFDMVSFRSSVAAILNGSASVSTLIPSIEPPKVPGGPPGRATIRRGSQSDLVKQVQIKLKINADGLFGAKTEAVVRAFQRDHERVPDGIVGPKTWAILDTIT